MKTQTEFRDLQSSPREQQRGMALEGATQAAPAPALDSSPDLPLQDWEPTFSPDLNGRKHANIARPISGRWVQTAYILIDAFFVSFNAVVAFYLRFLPEISTGWLPPGWPKLQGDFPWGQYYAFLLLYVVLVLLCCQSQDLYSTSSTRSRFDEAAAVVKAVAVATLLLMAFLYLSDMKSISRLVITCAGLQSIATLAAWRLWKRQFVISRVAQGIGTRNVLIVGAGKIGQTVARYLEENKHLGLAFCGFLDQNHCGDPRLLGTIEDLPRLARARFADEVIVTIPSERDLVKNVVLEARRLRLDVKVVPELFDGLGRNAPLQRLGDFPVMQLHREPIPGLGLVAKRLLDFLGSLLTLVILSPVLLLIALAIKLDSSGPVFYRSWRLGKKGRKFACYKFRTMVANAEALKADLLQRNERNGPFFKIAGDPRITRIGRFLRKYSLDELPQFWNVLLGDMSLVGPRPPIPDETQEYDYNQLRRLDVRPGITGLWQISARTDPSFNKMMALDLQYIEKWNLWLDFAILFKTIPAVLRGLGS